MDAGCLGPFSFVSHRKRSMPTRSLVAPSAVPDSASAERACFLNVKDAAAYLGISPHTLYVWRHRRQGPAEFPHGSSWSRHVPADSSRRLDP